ncbi:MAG TPA: hypothetical protein EYM35_09995 [Rhodospirillales bacterium]|nr:hypothetical protein [Rhodospirillales bacterium]
MAENPNVGGPEEGAKKEYRVRENLGNGLGLVHGGGYFPPLRMERQATARVSWSGSVSDWPLKVRAPVLMLWRTFPTVMLRAANFCAFRLAAMSAVLAVAKSLALVDARNAVVLAAVAAVLAKDALSAASVAASA